MGYPNVPHVVHVLLVAEVPMLMAEVPNIDGWGTNVDG